MSLPPRQVVTVSQMEHVSVPRSGHWAIGIKIKMTSLCGLLVTWSLSMSPKDGNGMMEIGIYLQTPYPI